MVTLMHKSQQYFYGKFSAFGGGFVHQEFAYGLNPAFQIPSYCSPWKHFTSCATGPKRNIFNYLTDIQLLIKL